MTTLRPQDDLFRAGRLIVAPADPHVDRMAVAARLGDEFDVRQGIAENPPRITRRIAERVPGQYRPGDGVFVLSRDEVERLGLSIDERRLLRPYFPQSAVSPFALDEDAARSLLYLTKSTAPELDSLPAVRRHLERFRPLLELRREVRTGTIAWWHLHWPREERLFLAPRILAPQMGTRPAFALVERPAFVGFAVNVVVARPRLASERSLAAVCGLLNSESARRWFAQHAKRRGANLDVGGRLLRQFPLPPRNAALEQELETLVARRLAAHPGDEPENSGAERRIDAVAAQLYGSVAEPGR